MARWYNSAACIGMDLALFFPPESPRGSNVNARGPEAREARKVCATCPVRRPCLAEALLTGDHGIRGGTSLLERNRMKRNHRKITTGYLEETE
jgi:WhiB family transcriptional regulator, redox-sensing transcriptional regulator